MFATARVDDPPVPILSRHIVNSSIIGPVAHLEITQLNFVHLADFYSIDVAITLKCTVATEP